MKKAIIALSAVLCVMACREKPAAKQEQAAQTQTEQAAAENEQQTIGKLVPKGYRFEEMRGDLNGDGKDDYVLILKQGTDSENVRGKTIDLSNRGIMIFFDNGNDYQLALENRSCFSPSPSNEEDSGIPPELSVSVEKGNLYIAYDSGRYGNSKYTFRYRDGEFVMIGYDENTYSSLNSNWGVIDKQTSINFLAKKRQTKTNVNEDENAEQGKEVFKETWNNIEIKKLMKLSEIANFDKLYGQYISKIKNK